MGIKYNELTITIECFDNAAMVDDPKGEVYRIIETLLKHNSDRTLYHMDGARLKDINGNNVGHVSVDWTEEEDQNET